MEKTVRELCLVCQGEKWLPDPLVPGRSRPCPYCGQLGWVEVSGPSLGEDPRSPAPPLGTPPAAPALPPDPQPFSQEPRKAD